MLPLCADFVHVSNFVERHSRYEYGVTTHAFCAAIKLLLREYTLLVAQLETLASRGGLTLQMLWFYVQPAMRTMEALANISQKAKKLAGGALLNMIQYAAAGLLLRTV